MMVKVCHLTSVHPRYDGRILQRECISLAQNGFEVFLIVNDDKDDEIYNGVHIISTRYKTNNKLKRILFTTRKVFQKSIEINADIYCFHDPELLPYVKLFNKLNKKVIFDCHEFYSLQLNEKKYLPHWFKKPAILVYQYLEKKLLKFVNVVLVPCTLDGKNYFDGKANKTVIISNLPKLNDFYIEYKNHLANRDGICYVGSLSYERGIYHLVKAAGLAERQVRLAGKYTSLKFESLICNLPEYSWIESIGYLSKDSVIKLYNNCSIGICTLLNTGQYNHIDTFATKIYEYMSMGMAVILSDTDYARKVLEKYPFGICVNPENIEEIAEAITYLSENPMLIQKMGEVGRNAVIKHFNWAVEEKKLIKLYQDLVEDM